MSEPRDWQEAHDILEELRLSAERSGAAPEDWANLPTKADMAAQSRATALAQRAAALAAYRSSHAIGAAVTDTTVWHLMMIEQIGKPSPAATAAHSAGGDEAREERTPRPERAR